MSLSLREERVGSSSWKRDSCITSPPSFTTVAEELFSSSAASVRSAESSTSRGIPAILATWIPKLWAEPPLASLRRKMT